MKGKPTWNKGKKGLQEAWNKGLTKETDSRVAQYGLTESQTKKDMYATGELVRPNKDSQLKFMKCDGPECDKIIRITTKWRANRKNHFCSRKCMIEFKKGKVIPHIPIGHPNYLLHQTEEAKEHMRAITRTEKWQKRHREVLINAKKKDTDIELKAIQQLEQNGIVFEKQINELGLPDIYIPWFNLYIFTDGCYTHACRKCKLVRVVNADGALSERGCKSEMQYYRDISITRKLRQRGFKVLRIWAHDIHKKDFDIMTYLKKYMLIIVLRW
jgi:DNA mismatch endonuclease, patch repair protein